jgi:hypothetical protein
MDELEVERLIKYAKSMDLDPASVLKMRISFIETERKAKYEAAIDTREFGQEFGLKIADNIVDSEGFQQRFIAEQRKKQGAVDRTLTADKAGNAYTDFLRLTTDAFGITTSEAELKKKASEESKKALEEAKKHLNDAWKYAEMGDVARSAEEIEAANKDAKINLAAAGLASPLEMYLRADQTRRARHLLARNERPRRMRIGQYE